MAAGAVLVASTLLVWMNHPRVAYQGGATPGPYVRDVSHTIGLATVPAGLLALTVGVLAIISAPPLKKGRVRAGVLALILALAASAISAAEIIQLLLGRRNWLSDLSASVGSSPLSNAVGHGVWLAALASLALLANAGTYLWLSLRLWRRARRVTN
jgi:hypothetical protein